MQDDFFRTIVDTVHMAHPIRLSHGNSSDWVGSFDMSFVDKKDAGIAKQV